jgi:low temperature requirement protein LtrA
LKPFVRTNLLRRRGDPDAARVTQVELFFDLVFVYAVTQLSHLLLSQFTPLGALHTAMLFVAVWWVWIYTSWVTNWLDPERRPVRLLLLAMMLAGLVLSTSLPRAFGDRGLVFAGAYAAMQVGRSLFMLWALRGYSPGNYRNFQRILVWLGGSAVLWLWGGFSDGAARLWLWLAALGVEFVSPAAGFWTPGLGRSTTRDWDVDGSHLAERCSAFVLIALGESITVAGAAFFELKWTAAVVAAFVTAFVMAVAMWWIYFDTAAERTSRRFAHHHDRGRIARVAYTYVHSALIAGIVLTAVANQRLLERPWGASDPASTAVLLGGPATYLLGNGVFRALLSPRFPPSHALGLGLLAVLAAASPFMAQLPLALAATAVTLSTAAVSALLLHRQHRPRPAPAVT